MLSPITTLRLTGVVMGDNATALPLRLCLPKISSDPESLTYRRTGGRHALAMPLAISAILSACASQKLVRRGIAKVSGRLSIGTLRDGVNYTWPWMKADAL